MHRDTVAPAEGGDTLFTERKPARGADTSGDERLKELFVGE